MPSKTFKIKEIGQVIGGGTPSTANSGYYGGDIPWLSPKDLSNYKKRYISHGEKNITKLGLDNSSAKLMPEGTVLLSSRAPIGYVAIAANEICTNQGFKSIIPNIDLVDSEFLYYSLKNNIEEIKDLGVGTTFAEISGKILENYEIELPELNNQKKIVSILSSLDRLIELNLEINANLTRQLEAIYCKIMNFESRDDLVNSELGPIPSGWTTTNVASFCIEMKNGATPSRNKEEYWKNGTIPWVVTGEVNDSIILQTKEQITEEGLNNSSAKILPVNSVIVAMYGRGTAARLGYLKVEATTNQACCGMICSSPNRSAFLYETLHQMHDYIDSLASGSAQQNLSKEIIGNLSFVCPPPHIIESLNLSLIIDSIASNEKDNQKLIELRDFLLPKLMSGEIDVSNLPLPN